jgi:hypothetical protein
MYVEEEEEEEERGLIKDLKRRGYIRISIGLHILSCLSMSLSLPLS